MSVTSTSYVGEGARVEKGPCQRPNVCVVTHRFGLASEVWLQRQLAGFSNITPWVLTGAIREESGFVNTGLSISEFDYMARTETRAERWITRLRCLPSRNFFAPRRDQMRKLEDELVRRRTDALLCHFGPTALSLLPSAMALKIPLVAHFHGFDLSSALRGRWYRWSLLANLKKFAAIVVVGTQQRRWMISSGADPDRIHLIPCGVPTDEFVPAQRAVGQSVKFIAVARLVAGKGLEFTLRAFAQVIAAGQVAELTVIGEGPARPQLERLICELDLQSVVGLRGQQRNSVVKEELRQADVFVQHSIESADGSREGFGVSLAEAAASGLPIVATRCGGIPDQVMHEQTGLLVDQRNVAAMAKAMLQLAKNAELRGRLGRAGRARMLEEFDTKSQVRKLEEVLIAAASRRARPSRSESCASNRFALNTRQRAGGKS